MVAVATEDSLNHSMNSALKHYSSMFFLPSFQKAVAAVAVICIGGVGLSTFALTLQLPSLSLIDGLIRSFFLGVSVFAAVLFADYVISKIVLGIDPIYVLRRAVALSLLGCFSLFSGLPSELCSVCCGGLNFAFWALPPY
jgi:hypothetical protein